MFIMLFIAGVLVILAIIAQLLLNARIEVRPATALVYNDIWSGDTDVVFAGTEFIIPGIHRVLEKEVSLRNEAENPSNVNLVTAEGVDLEVDYIVRHLQVGYPGMPSLTDPRMDYRRLKLCVIQSVTEIDYAKRRDKILTRIVAKLQESVDKRTVNELFPGTDLKTGIVGKLDKGVMEKIEDEVNEALLLDQVTKTWGFWVEIDLEDYNLPTIIAKAREQQSAAEIGGKAIQDKAKAAGVEPIWVLLTDALSNLLGPKSGGGK